MNRVNSISYMRRKYIDPNLKTNHSVKSLDDIKDKSERHAGEDKKIVKV